MNNHKKKFWLIFPLVALAIGLFVWFFQLLWNCILPDVIGVKSINYWQSFGILLISKILFGGIGCRGGRTGFTSKIDVCNNSNFSEEEKAKFRNAWIEKLRQNCKNS